MTRQLQENLRGARNTRGQVAVTAILDVAEQLVQTRGYNGFSYADVATALCITKASIHYHFPSKADLGRALIERYRTGFTQALDSIDQTTIEPKDRIRRYVGLYESVLSNERMCLCGMLAAESATLPEPMQESLNFFFDDNERWLTAVLEDGARTGAFHLREPANERARVLIAALEGAMLLARSYGSPGRFHSVAAPVLADLNVFV